MLDLFASTPLTIATARKRKYSSLEWTKVPVILTVNALSVIENSHQERTEQLLRHQKTSNWEVTTETWVGNHITRIALEAIGDPEITITNQT
jgi:hypothetical protein